MIDAILEGDSRVPRKQRHTAKRVFERLKDEYGFDGQYTIVKDYVRERGRRTQEMFVPLSHAPGHAQCDFGEAVALIAGVERKVHYFVLDLPHSDGCFVKAYPAETTEAFLDGHVSAFALLGGAPQSILYDNTKLAVARILGDGRRKRTRAFTELQSHYLFEDRFGRPGKGNDKGKVEGMVGYVRRNFLVPVPRVESFRGAQCPPGAKRAWSGWTPHCGGTTETIGQRMERDLDALLPLPAVPYDACDKQASRVSSLSLVRYRTNDYSAPVAYGHRDVLVRGYVDQVVISSGAEVIARHPRSYEQDDFVFDPIHYLPLLERKTAALDQAAPLQGWDLPEEYRTLRRLLEARMGQTGQAGIRAGAAAAGELLPSGGPPRRQGRPPAGRHQLRRREAPAAVPHGRQPTSARSGPLSLPAPGEREDHPRHGLHEPLVGEGGMSARSTLLLEHHLKELKLPTFLREYRKLATQCAAAGH